MAAVLRSLLGEPPAPNALAFLEVLLPAVARCPDPDRAVANLAEVCRAGGSRLALFADLISSPELRANLLHVLSHSQVFADVLIASPEWLEVVRQAQPRAPRREDLVRTAWSAYTAMPTKLSRRNALRRVRKRELLRIGADDILERASFEETVAAISTLAEACLESSLALVAEELSAEYGCPLDDEGRPVAFAVIGLGKLGGAELNYASDVDVIFVGGGDGRTDGERSISALDYFDRLARGLIACMSEPLEEGFLFRTDPRLRPEGKAGPLVRTLEACRIYYESYGRAWERQALIKARPCAGDLELGDAFVRATRPFVYGRRLDDADLRELRRLKSQQEAAVVRKATADRDVKQGPGGIRDVEYVIQILQLMVGADHPEARLPGSLPALAALGTLGALTPAEVRDLRDGYVFARRAEHALQVRDQFQTHELPADNREREILARRLGRRSLEDFDADRAAHAARVRVILVETLENEPWHGEVRRSPLQRHVFCAGGESAEPATQAEAELARLGFADPASALGALSRMALRRGPLDDDPREDLAAGVDALCAAAAASGDADEALSGLERLSGVSGSPRSFFRLLMEEPQAAELLSTLAGRSRFLTAWLERRPELLDMVLDPAALASSRTREELEELLAGAAGGRSESADQRLRRVRRRETLRIGMREVTGLARMHETSRELADLAEALLDSGLEAALAEAGAEGAPIGVVGLGSFGSRELHAGSDLDVVFAHASEDAGEVARVTRAVRALLREFAETTSEGELLDVDARLRPEGRSGTLVPGLEAVRSYIEGRARPWERVAATRARPVGGAVEVAEELAGLYRSLAYGRPLLDEDRASIHEVRERVEAARDASTEGRLDLKLCRGGLLDLDLAVRMVQIEAGTVAASVRAPGLWDAVRLLARAGALPAALSERISAAWRLLKGLEMRLRIADELPSGLLDLSRAALAVMARKLPREVERHTLSADDLRAGIDQTRSFVRRLYERVVESGSQGLAAPL